MRGRGDGSGGELRGDQVCRIVEGSVEFHTDLEVDTLPSGRAMLRPAPRFFGRGLHSNITAGLGYDSGQFREGAGAAAEDGKVVAREGLKLDGVVSGDEVYARKEWNAARIQNLYVNF